MKDVTLHLTRQELIVLNELISSLLRNTTSDYSTFTDLNYQALGKIHTDLQTALKRTDK